MNEIQAVKTAKIEEVKKNSKKGFTLVELVVVIAILAILAAIAIPVVSSTIQSSQRSSALSNAQTLELALKEAHAQIVAKDYTVYSTNKDNTTVADVVKAKAITVPNTVKIGSDTYTLNWCKADSKCYYVNGTDNLDSSVTLTSKTLTTLDASATATSSDKVMSLFNK